MKLKKAILNSLCYRAVFNYPLTFYQLSTFLFTIDGKFSLANYKKALDELVNEGKIEYVFGKYQLPRENYVHWDKRHEASKTLIKKVERISEVLSKIPWIKFIGATGTVSAFAATEDDDIDVLIIAQKNRLWLVRGFVFVILKILGELRSDKKPQRKICPNIFLSEDNLVWGHGKNEYVANETLMMYPLYDKNDTYFRFLYKNNWIFDYFEKFKVSFVKMSDIKSRSSFVMKLLEKLSFVLQKKYMEGKQTTETIEKDRIHFNKTDHTDRILDKYNELKSKYI